MRISTKISAVVLAAAGMLAMGAAASTAFADTPATTGHSAAPSAQRAVGRDAGTKVGSPQFSRGFHVYNLTQFPMRLDAINGDNHFEGAPAIGSIVQPGQYADFEVQIRWMTDQNDDAMYTLIGPNRTFDAHMQFDDSFGTKHPGIHSSCSTQYGICTAADSTILSVRDPAGTVVNVPGGQGQAQADILKALCDGGTDQASCAFTPTGETHTTGADHQVGPYFDNDTNLNPTWKVTKDDSVGTSDSLGVSLTAGTNLFNLVDTSLTATYQHQWTQNHTFSYGVDVPVPAHTRVWVNDSPDMIRDTGDFTVTMANTTWHLTGVYFDSPNPAGTGTWSLHSASLNGGPTTVTRLK